MTIASLLREGSQALAAAGIPTPSADTEVLLAHLMTCDRARLHAHSEEAVAREVEVDYREGITRRASREPLQYITGLQEFWSLPFNVSPAVMIPRPETELIVEACVARCSKLDPRVVDIATGSGCVAVAVARELPGALVHATDLSEEALDVARLNAARNDVGGRLAFYQGDVYEPLRNLGLEGYIDFVLSNPPYVAESDLATLEPEVRDHEPRAALTPGPDPLAVHRRVAAQAPEFLVPGGFVIVEFGIGQTQDVSRAYASVAGLEVEEVLKDLAGLDRVLVVRAAPAAR